MYFAYIHLEAVGTDAWINNFNVPLELDYSRNTNFSGRHEALEHIHCFRSDIRSNKREAIPLVIHGTGGVGKTQLVQEYAYAHVDDFSSIISVDAQSFYTTQSSSLRFLQRLIDLHARIQQYRRPHML